MTPTDEDMKVARDLVILTQMALMTNDAEKAAESIARALASQREACAQIARAAYTKERAEQLTTGIGVVLLTVETAFKLGCDTAAGEIERAAVRAGKKG